MGTDDRTIREYITTQSRELSRRYRNIYYVIVSSSFADDFDDTIASIKMETEVSDDTGVRIEGHLVVGIRDPNRRRESIQKWHDQAKDKTPGAVPKRTYAVIQTITSLEYGVDDLTGYVSKKIEIAHRFQ